MDFKHAYNLVKTASSWNDIISQAPLVAQFLNPSLYTDKGAWSHVADVNRAVIRGALKAPGSVISFAAKAPYRASRLADLAVNWNDRKYSGANGFFDRWRRSKHTNRGKLGSGLYTWGDGLDAAQEEQADKLGLAYKGDFSKAVKDPYIRASKGLAEASGGLLGSILLGAGGSQVAASINNSVQAASVPSSVKAAANGLNTVVQPLLNNANGSYSNLASNLINQSGRIPQTIKNIGTVGSAVFDTAWDAANCP